MRLGALELQKKVPPAETYGQSQSLDFLTQHVERLQQGGVSVAAGLSELFGRLETEAKARAKASAEQSAGLEALGQVLSLSRGMQQATQQRLEALEERMGAERQELAVPGSIIEIRGFSGGFGVENVVKS